MCAGKNGEALAARSCPGKGGSEKLSQGVPFAGFQFLDSFSCFQSDAVCLAVRDESFECLGQRERGFLPLFTEGKLSQTFAFQFSGRKANEHDGFSVAPGDDCGFVMSVGNHHGPMVSVSLRICGVKGVALAAQAVGIAENAEKLCKKLSKGVDVLIWFCIMRVFRLVAKKKVVKNQLLVVFVSN